MKRALPKMEIGAKPPVKSQIIQSALQRWQPEVQAAMSDEGATISIFDVIGQDYFGEGVTAKRIGAALRSIGDRPVTVYINSPGGDVFEGFAIYNLLREHRQEVTVKVVGLAASAASFIAMAGDEVQIGRAGFLMIHNAWVVAMGNRHDLREIADWLAPFDAAQTDIFAARTGLDPSGIATMLDKETWLSGSEAVDQGFADGFLPADEVMTASDAEARPEARSVRAERKFDILAAQSGIARSEARKLLRDIKGGARDAAPTGAPEAAALLGEVDDLLQTVKSLRG